MIDLCTKLRDLAKRVDRNVPSHTDPARFHEEKSEIVRDLEALAQPSRETVSERGI